MKLQQLRFFVAVADERGFSRAAEKLHIAQPSLSVQIKALESEIGARLFERDKHRVFLTQAGKRFQEHARAILARAETAKSEARSAAAGEVGTVELGYTASAMFSSVLPRSLRQFAQRFPKVVVSLHEMPSLEQLHALLERRIDAGVLRHPDVHTPVGLEVSEWHHTPLVVALPKDHALGRRKSVALIELKDEAFIAYPREAGTGIYWQVMDLCAKAGFRPRVVREVLESATLIGLIAAGLGVAVVPVEMSCIRFEGVAYRPLTDENAHSTLYLAQRKGDRNPHLQALLQILTKISVNRGR